MAIKVQDSIVLEVGEQRVKSTFRDVPGTNGLKWRLEIYRGRRMSPFTEAYIHIAGGSANVRAFITGGGLTKNLTEFFADGDTYGFQALCPVAALRRHSNIIACLIKFQIPVVAPVTLKELNNSSNELCKIVVGAEHFNVMRQFVQLMSPVFADMLQGDGTTITIEGFSMAVVRESINYSFGADIGEKTVPQVIAMSELALRYQMASLIAKLENWLIPRITPEDFAAIAAHAWKCERVGLQTECAKVFKAHKKIVNCHKFVAMEAQVIVGVLQMALSLGDGGIPNEAE